MALLRRSLSLFRHADPLQRTSILILQKTLSASLLHTMETPSNGLLRSFIPALLHEQQNIKYNTHFSVCKSLNNAQILPSLPRGKNAVLDLPALPMISDLQMPTSKAHLNNAHIMPEKVRMEDPQPLVRIEKHAVRMIRIRRNKMKKHQRRKFYKKNRVVYARIRQARKAIKEKNLQLKLLAQLNEGRNFSPEKYAFDLLSAAYEKVELPPKHVKKKPWEF